MPSNYVYVNELLLAFYSITKNFKYICENEYMRHASKFHENKSPQHI